MLKKHQLEDLHHTACKGFVYYQNEENTKQGFYERFENIEGKENTKKDFYKDGSMYWYHDHISALLCFNHYCKEYPHTLLLWDIGDWQKPNYCVLVNKPFGLLK